MKVLVNARHIERNKEMIEYVKRRLQFALGEKFERVKRVNVTLSDINGPKGGDDKRCLMVLRLKGQADVVIDTLHTELHAAIDRAAERAARSVSKRINRLRQRSIRHKPVIA